MPINVKLPDGSVRTFEKPVTAREVAASIGPGLAKAAIGCRIDGELRDLDTEIRGDASLAIVTAPKPGQAASADALYLMRHSAAHVMAEAIQDVVGKDVLLAYGPPTETGFFYDMYVPEGKLSSDQFEAINKQMEKIIKEDRRFTRYDPTAAEGIAKLLGERNKYKLDNALKALQFVHRWSKDELGRDLLLLVSDGEERRYANVDTLFADTSDAERKQLANHMLSGYQNAGAQSSLSFYSTGPAEPSVWNDLCRGPHVPSTARIGAARVMSLASSFWHGDENSDRLTRVYGTAFASQADLDAYLNQLEEAKKRDHRVIGKQLRLFHIDEEVGQGLVLWTPAGGIIRQELQTFIGDELRKQGYFQVFTPHIGRLDLYKTSGHFPYYKESQYPPIIERDALARLSAEGCSCADLMNRVEGVSARLAAELNERTKKQTIAPDRVLPDDQLIDGFLLKPMNCPHHAKIFASSPHSYRDMPVRLAEFGTVYRWEQSGELSGMLRVRAFTQDDAHLFCTEDQLGPEMQGCLAIVKLIFGTLGIKDYRIRVGLRDPDSDKYTGTRENWDKAEAACLEAAQTLGAPFSREPGEAAFYGPKIDFVVKDVIGREWQLGTVQVDYNMAIRFDLSYIGPDNKPHRPVVIHRAPFGSLERFCGFLIEHFAGAFPTWLAPEQARVLPISEKTNAYGESVLAALKAAGVRATIDTGNDRVQGKIKVAAEMKIPYLLVVGPRDEEGGQVSVRARGIQKDLGAVPFGDFIASIRDEIGGRAALLALAQGV